MDEGKASYLYVELDFKEVTSKKATLIESYSQLRDKVGGAVVISRAKGEVLSDHYKLFPIDLCDVQKLDDIIALANMDPRERLAHKFFKIWDISAASMPFQLNYKSRMCGVNAARKNKKRYNKVI